MFVSARSRRAPPPVLSRCTAGQPAAQTTPSPLAIAQVSWSSVSSRMAGSVSRRERAGPAGDGMQAGTPDEVLQPGRMEERRVDDREAQGPRRVALARA